MSASSFLMIFFSVSLNALAQVVLRKAMLVMGKLPPFSNPLGVVWVMVQNVYLWAGLACYAFSILTWLAVLSRVPVSVAYPMLSIGYIIAAVLAFAFLGEGVSMARAFGIGLICVGVVLVARTA